MILSESIHLNFNPTAPLQQEVNPQNARLAKVIKIEAYLLDELTEIEKLAKKVKYLVTISNAVIIGSITTAFINVTLYYHAFTSVLVGEGLCW